MDAGQTSRKKTLGLIRRINGTSMVQKLLTLIFRVFNFVGGHAVRTKVGATIFDLIFPKLRPVLCAACFTDLGLRSDAGQIGFPHALRCPNCGARGAKKLDHHLVQALAYRFFVRGSVLRLPYGSAPLVQFNESRYRNGDYKGPRWLQQDIALVNEKGGIGLFYYGPRLWMVGEVEPLKALQSRATRKAIVERILKEYPERTLLQGEVIYRLRRNPANPLEHREYDSPPDGILGRGRLDSPEQPVLYCSQDIESCIHECRVTVEDELYLAALKPIRDLKLLDLTVVLKEEHVTEFESLDMAVHMLFFAGDHSYEISRAIASAAVEAGFDGVLYPSYFSQVRSGAMPLETVYGISVRRFPNADKYAASGIFPNVALFGRPLRDGKLGVACIDRLIIHKARYDFTFGPAPDRA